MKTIPTYKINKDLTLYEVNRGIVNGKEYLLLLQKQEPNFVYAGYLKEDVLKLVEDSKENIKVIKELTRDYKQILKNILPCISDK